MLMFEFLFYLAKPSISFIGFLITTAISVLSLWSKENTMKKAIKRVSVLVLPICIILLINWFCMSQYTQVPMVMELPYFTAAEKLNNASLLYESPRKDQSVFVQYQYPAPGRIVKKNSYVDIYCEEMGTEYPVLYNNFELEVNHNILIETTLRQMGDKGSGSWRKNIAVELGDEFELQVHYRNGYENSTENVMIKIVFPDGIEYVPDSTLLYNTTNPSGIIRDETIATTGVNIGGYASYGDGYVRLKCVLTKKPTNDTTTFVVWGQADVSNDEVLHALQDYAEIKCIG